jgi:ubiquinone/menaquinone biosynthesis C-methylase UbiE
MLHDEAGGRVVANENQSSYQLGHSEAELKRLMVQASVLRPITEQLLRRAGIRPGMRILDVGCGAGDVSMLAADLVGPSGSVVGIDRSAEALALAEHRAQPYRNIAFRQADVQEYDGDKSFDMVVARYVLLHQPDPVPFLRAAARLVRPSGVVAIHDISTHSPIASEPTVALWDEVGLTLKRAAKILMVNIDRTLGTRAFFERAGLTDVTASYEVIAGHGKGSNIFPWLADTARLFITAAQAKSSFDHNLPSFDGLAQRLEADATALDAEVTAPLQVCVWGTVA